MSRKALWEGLHILAGRSGKSDLVEGLGFPGPAAGVVWALQTSLK